MSVHSQKSNSYITFNDDNRTIIIADTNEVFSYDDITAIEFKEERGKLGRGGIARAFSTSFFDDLSGVFIATEISIRIKLRNEHNILISFLKTPVKSNTLIYRLLKEQADKVHAKLKEIHPNTESDDLVFDYTNELRELKRLVDEGIITKEDFEMKKSKILGI